MKHTMLANEINNLLYDTFFDANEKKIMHKNIAVALWSYLAVVECLYNGNRVNRANNNRKRKTTNEWIYTITKAKMLNKTNLRPIMCCKYHIHNLLEFYSIFLLLLFANTSLCISNLFLLFLCWFWFVLDWKILLSSRFLLVFGNSKRLLYLFIFVEFIFSFACYRIYFYILFIVLLSMCIAWERIIEFCNSLQHL